MEETEPWDRPRIGSLSDFFGCPTPGGSPRPVPGLSCVGLCPSVIRLDDSGSIRDRNRVSRTGLRIHWNACKSE